MQVNRLKITYSGGSGTRDAHGSSESCYRALKVKIKIEIKACPEIT
jgi:hypothetical protein